MSWCVWVCGAAFLACLWLGTGQLVSISEEACVNGDLVSSSKNSTVQICQCYPGWSGPNCSFCRGRVRLTNSSGVISEDLRNMNYSSNMNCLFYVEADRSVESIHVALRLLDLECQWDYLTLFDGDSITAPKIAAYTGNLSDLDDNTLFTASSSGPDLLLYFYSDVAVEDAGFELTYWVDYECPNFCSGRGVCDNSTGACFCPPEWSGAACEVEICPSNCSDNGVCDTDSGTCACEEGFQGESCFVDESLAHWTTAPVSPSDVPASVLARASHSAVVWQDSLLVYGGYRFPDQGYSYFDMEGSEMEGSGMVSDEEGSEMVSNGDLLRYSLEANLWTVLNTSATTFSLKTVSEGGSGSGEGSGSQLVQVPQLPSPRYGHSAVIYEDSMYVYGGALVPSELIVAELWKLNLTSLQWTPLFNTSTDTDNSSVESTPQPSLPVAVRGHTAHVVGSKMVVLFGLSPEEETFPPYVQEYDLVSGEWSLVERDNSSTIAGRVGHTSVYSEDTGLIYIHGGFNTSTKPQLISYDPICHVWTSLTPSDFQLYLHSSFLLGPFLVSFAGCEGHGDDHDCFSRNLLLYNTLCDSWESVELPGLPANASRYGHTSVLDPRDGSTALVFGGFTGTLRSDMLRLVMENCSQWTEKEDCLGTLCAWRSQEELCVSVGTLTKLGETNISFSTCNVSRTQDLPTSCPSPSVYQCVDFSSCQDCVLYGCHWGIPLNKTHEQCFSDAALRDPTLNITEMSTCTAQSCYATETCGACTTKGCLWCPSLEQCFPGHGSLYSVTFNFGQCLGWTKSCDRINCQDMKNCSSCQELPQCGWCNDPSNTGLGECSLGGFGGPRNAAACQGTNTSDFEGAWQFYQCSACQCNGHSVCVNDSVCEECMDNTAGEYCESCALGYYGNASNGGDCVECDCNGYDTECNVVSGTCLCHSLGVVGEKCTNCSGDYNSGVPENFCYSNLEVGFIYTFSATSSNEVQGFYAVTPTEDASLHFNFDIRSNPSGLPVYAQLFLGRKSENLWVLTNLTGLMEISPQGSFDDNYDSFYSADSNRSDPMLTSFAHPSIRDSENFSAIFDAVQRNDYTNSMWDRDVSLVLHVSNLNSPCTFRITVDQQNYIYLLYFFATFITCFSILLGAFLLVWYIKKKLALRAYMRRQYIELQRRVARPFTKVMVEVDNTPVSTTPLPTEQNPSYLGVEACHNDRAAVLSLLVQLPGDHNTGRPSMGRTGVCIGSTLVYVNGSKKPKEKKKDNQQSQNGVAVTRRRGRQRREQRTVAQTAEEQDSSFLVHTGRARLRSAGNSVI